MIFDMKAFMAKKDTSTNSLPERLSVYLTLLGGTLLLASRFISTDSLRILARDLRFRQPLEKWQFYEITNRIALFRDAMWLAGLLIVILALIHAFGKPAWIKRLLDHAALHPKRSLPCFLLFLQIVLSLMFLLTEQRLWNQRMYSFPAGSQEQRKRLCGIEYLDTQDISEYFNPGDRVLLSGEHVSPFFINYYLYPIQLYLYDDRMIPPHETYSPYVKNWMERRKMEYILVYTPFRDVHWHVLGLRKKKDDTP